MDDRVVTTFTASDFARTLSSNGRGSDHAWGGNHLVLGGARQSDATSTARFPIFTWGIRWTPTAGRLIPTTSCDEYFAELALWFGVPTPDLELVLPNIGRFYTPGSSTPPVGFLGAAGAGFREPADHSPAPRTSAAHDEPRGARDPLRGESPCRCVGEGSPQSVATIAPTVRGAGELDESLDPDNDAGAGADGAGAVLPSPERSRTCSRRG